MASSSSTAPPPQGPTEDNFDLLAPALGRSFPLTPHLKARQSVGGETVYGRRCWNDARGFCAWPGISSGPYAAKVRGKRKTCKWGNSGPPHDRLNSEEIPGPRHLQCLACLDQIIE